MISPPTDSLYKFVAISGIVLIIWGLSFPWSKSYEFELETEELASKTTINKEMAEILRTEAEQIGNEIRELTKESKDSTQLPKLRMRQRDIQIQLVEAQASVDSALARQQVLKKANDTYRQIGLGSSLVGGLFVLLGFIAWYTRLQRYIDRDAKAVRKEE